MEPRPPTCRDNPHEHAVLVPGGDDPVGVPSDSFLSPFGGLGGASSDLPLGSCVANPAAASSVCQLACER